jgi:hypothetical protein
MVNVKQRLKQYALLATAAALLWFVLDNHFVFNGKEVHLLKKSSLNLHDTFVSLDNKRPASVMQNDRLREAGIGELMVEIGLLSEEEHSRLESKLDYSN